MGLLKPLLGEKLSAFHQLIKEVFQFLLNNRFIKFCQFGGERGLAESGCYELNKISDYLKKALFFWLLGFLCHELNAQRVENYKVDLKLSDLRVYDTISLDDIGETDLEGSEFLSKISGVTSSEKVDFDFWKFKRSEDEFYFVNTQRDVDGWDLAQLTLKGIGSSLSIKNVSFAVGDNISKLNSLYPTAYDQRGLNIRNNTYCAILEIEDLTGGISIAYDNETGKILKITFTQLLH